MSALARTRVRLRAMERGISHGPLWAVSFGHLSIDILNSSVAILLTALVGKFALSNAELAWGITLYFVVSALPMPLFGLLADRWQGRWLSQAGLLWTVLAFAYAPYTTNYITLLTVLSIGGLGSAAFHASSTRTASLSGGAQQTGTATSAFFFLGQIGLSSGPVLAGLLIGMVGPVGITYMALAVLPMVGVMQYALRRPLGRAPLPARGGSGPTKAGVTMTVGPVLLGLYIVMRSATMQNYMSLLPKYFADQDLASAVYGARAGMLVLGGSVGTLVGGVLGDYVSRKKIMIWSLWLSIPFLVLLLNQDGLLFYAAAFVAGLITNTAHSIIIVQAQSMLPRREGLASGLALGIMFASGAFTTGLAGTAADFWGLSHVMYFLALLPLFSGALLLWPARLSLRPTPSGVGGRSAA